MNKDEKIATSRKRILKRIEKELSEDKLKDFGEPKKQENNFCVIETLSDCDEFALYSICQERKFFIIFPLASLSDHHNIDKKTFHCYKVKNLQLLLTECTPLIQDIATIISNYLEIDANLVHNFVWKLQPSTIEYLESSREDVFLTSTPQLSFFRTSFPTSRQIALYKK
jgi:hypothetical protein